MSDLPTKEEREELRQRYGEWHGPPALDSSKFVTLALLDLADQLEAERDRLKRQFQQFTERDMTCGGCMKETRSHRVGCLSQLLEKGRHERDRLKEQLAVAVRALEDYSKNCWCSGLADEALAQLRDD